MEDNCCNIFGLVSFVEKPLEEFFFHAEIRLLEVNTK
jgi:hypothetical protein